MTQAQHTPGPWHRNIKPVSRYPIVFAGRNTHVARVETQGLSEDEAEANCALIAAAPDMLAALELAFALLAKIDDITLVGCHPDEHNAACDGAQAAIANARAS